MPTLWYCCECNFGPHNSALHDACINCGNQRCDECVDEKVSMRLNDLSNSPSHCHHETSPYPSVVAINTAHALSLDTKQIAPVRTADLPQVRPLSGPGPAVLASPLGGGLKLYNQTYMYVCCNCNDGPKVYDVQPVCVICHHKACSGCTQVK